MSTFPTSIIPIITIEVCYHCLLQNLTNLYVLLTTFGGSQEMVISTSHHSFVIGFSLLLCYGSYLSLRKRVVFV